MRFLVALAAASVALAACGPEPAAQQAAATVARTNPPAPVRALPNCSAPITGYFGVHVNAGSQGVSGDSIFCLSVSGRDVNTRLLEWPVSDRQLLAASAGSVVQVEGGAVDGSNVVVVFDPVTQARQTLGTLTSLGIGQPGPVGAVMAPDGKRIALGGGHELLLIDLTSGVASTLATATGELFLLPIRWTPDGILAEQVPYDGMGDSGLLEVNPMTGAVAVINHGPNNQLATSPDGRYLVFTTNVDLGDRHPWQNAIELTGPDGHATQIASEKDHWFTPLDVTNDGDVLFTSDSQSDPPAADMGVYTARNGTVSRQLSSGVAGEWGTGRFLDASTIVVAHLMGGRGAEETSADLERYELCSGAATDCAPYRTTVISISGTWPTAIAPVIVLPPSA